MVTLFLNPSSCDLSRLASSAVFYQWFYLYFIPVFSYFVGIFVQFKKDVQYRTYAFFAHCRIIMTVSKNGDCTSQYRLTKIWL
ncbi:hypothetical protein GDO78_005677 [Eleutherodactylus coqui]|uniref:Uncharacterized protein n=1 Tax=Eleutherodactylus coqui TaxID=57060 RepID=A0A8J6FKY9_ELECQ|nr:hypothetical protein GDO78_005677 [Eleutherodactylus coqui]